MTIAPREGPGQYLGEIHLASAEQRDLGELILLSTARLDVTVQTQESMDADPFTYLILSQLDPLGGPTTRYVASATPEEWADGIALVPGTYLARAQGAEGVATELATFTIEAATSRALLALHPRPGNRGLVGVEVAEQDDLPSSVHLVLRDDSGLVLAEVDFIRDRQRRYTFDVQLAEGRYTLKASTPEGGSIKHSFTLPAPFADQLPFEEVVGL